MVFVFFHRNFYEHYIEWAFLLENLGQQLLRTPLAAKFPWQSPYCSMDNNPICLNDIFGLESSKGKEKKTEYDDRSAREHRRAARNAIEMNDQFRNDKAGKRAEVFQYEKNGRYRYGIEIRDYNGSTDIPIDVPKTSEDNAGAGVMRKGKVIDKIDYTLVGNWWSSVNKEGFEGGLSYYSKNGMAPPGKPFAGRYAEATDGTIMPGAMAGGSKPMAGAERIKELLGAADKTWDQLKEEWDKRQTSSGTGTGTQSTGHGQQDCLQKQYFELHESGRDSSLVKIDCSGDTTKWDNTRRGMQDSWSIQRE